MCGYELRAVAHASKDRLIFCGILCLQQRMGGPDPEPFRHPEVLISYNLSIQQS